MSAAHNLAMVTLGTAGLVSPAHAAVEPFVSFTTGFAHPGGGIDHILAMVTIGVCGVLAGGRAVSAWLALLRPISGARPWPV